MVRGRTRVPVLRTLRLRGLVQEEQVGSLVQAVLAVHRVEQSAPARKVSQLLAVPAAHGEAKQGFDKSRRSSSTGGGSSKVTGDPEHGRELAYGSISRDKWPGVRGIGHESPEGPSGVDGVGGEGGGPVTEAEDGTGWLVMAVLGFVL